MTTGISVTVEVTGAAIASGFATVALVFLPTKIGDNSGTINSIHYYQDLGKPFGDKGDLRTGRGDKTQYYFWKDIINNENYFPGLGPGGPQGPWLKWLRNAAGGAALLHELYKGSHPDTNK